MRAVGCHGPGARHPAELPARCCATSATRSRTASRVYDVTFENVQAGERTSHLFRLANFHNGLVVGTGDLSELALGWCTYGVGDHMSHYNVNASVPKTLIQHLIRWVAETERLGAEASETLLRILDTEISPELVPPSGTEDGRVAAVPVHRGEDRPVRAAGLHALLHAALRLPAAEGRVPGLLGLARRRARHLARASRRSAADEYDLAEIKAHLEIFLYRFFQLSQFKRSCIPNAPEGRLGRLALAARRLARAQRRRGHGLAEPAGAHSGRVAARPRASTGFLTVRERELPLSAGGAGCGRSGDGYACVKRV